MDEKNGIPEWQAINEIAEREWYEWQKKMGFPFRALRTELHERFLQTLDKFHTINTKLAILGAACALNSIVLIAVITLLLK